MNKPYPNFQKYRMNHSFKKKSWKLSKIHASTCISPLNVLCNK